MTDPIRPVSRISSLGALVPVSAGRRDAAGPSGGDRPTVANLPVPTATPVVEELEPQAVSEAAYAAQVMGQGGQKRGLRGGRETLDRARSTYLGTEYSGPADRRPGTGRITKTEI